MSWRLWIVLKVAHLCDVPIDVHGSFFKRRMNVRSVARSGDVPK
jgi:hypothetical protein